MDKCKEIQALFADYRTGILNPRQASCIEDHISQCSDCAKELRVLDDVLALVDSNVPDYEPPVGLWNGVANRLTSPTPRSTLFKRLMTKPLRTIGAGIAVVALTATLFVSNSNHTSPPMRITSGAQYMEAHALYAGQAPLADRVGYLSVVAASAEASQSQTK